MTKGKRFADEAEADLHFMQALANFDLGTPGIGTEDAGPTEHEEERIGICILPGCGGEIVVVTKRRNANPKLGGQPVMVTVSQDCYCEKCGNVVSESVVRKNQKGT